MKFWIGNEKGLGQINIYITRVSNRMVVMVS